MFGRKDEDYDEYNEKYASKYDDDYVAPSHDYRRECTHSHEQTYDDMDDLWECRHSHEQTYQNITEVRECDHSHEQTYDDADYEQRPYDRAAAQWQSYAGNTDLEAVFAPYLAQGEHLLWAGGKGRPDQPDAEARKKHTTNATVLIILGIILLFSCIGAVVGMLLLVFGIIELARSEDCLMAVTDQRVIVRYNNNSHNIWLNTIKDIAVVSKKGNMGRLQLMLDEQSVSFDLNRRASDIKRGSMNYYFSPAVEDPERVKRIIEDAIISAQINKID